jgi:hypothetical protein
MVNEEIYGGIKAALERGNTLKSAMMSFYNTGYKKEEIEAAAREAQLDKRRAYSPVSTYKGKPIPIEKPLKKKETPKPPSVQDKMIHSVKNIFSIKEETLDGEEGIKEKKQEKKKEVKKPLPKKNVSEYNPHKEKKDVLKSKGFWIAITVISLLIIRFLFTFLLSR